MKASIVAFCMVTLGAAASAAQNSEADFVQACVSQSNLSQEVCTCSAKKARAELSEGGFAHLVATLEGDAKKAESIRSTLPFDQVMKSGMFMTHGPAQCAKEAPAQ